MSLKEFCRFAKYHAIGNDYLVIEPGWLPLPPANLIQRLCHRNFGAGSDGILYGPLESKVAEYQLRIFNPDGSEAEKSGNGLRIFCRHMFDSGLVSLNTPFHVETKGGIVRCSVHDEGRTVIVEMGRATFDSREIPVVGDVREVLQESIAVGSHTFSYCAVSVGNPHCVIVLPEISEALAKEAGPLLERHALFPNRTNVQFLKVLDRHHIQIEIWERGAGYTLSSGSSSSACAAVAVRLDLCDSPVTVHMPGGDLAIDVNGDFGIRMSGPVTAVASGSIWQEAVQDLLGANLEG